MVNDPPQLPPLSVQPSRAEVAVLLSAIKHDLVGMMQAVKVGLDLLAHEGLDSESAHEVLSLMRENIERSFAYMRMLDDVVHQLKSD